MLDSGLAEKEALTTGCWGEVSGYEGTTEAPRARRRTGTSEETRRGRQERATVGGQERSGLRLVAAGRAGQHRQGMEYLVVAAAE